MQVHTKDVIVHPRAPLTLTPPLRHARQGCDYPIEPHPHHTLLASFGEDTTETEKDMDNTHMHVV